MGTLIEKTLSLLEEFEKSRAPRLVFSLTNLKVVVCSKPGGQMSHSSSL